MVARCLPGPSRWQSFLGNRFPRHLPGQRLDIRLLDSRGSAFEAAHSGIRKDAEMILGVTTSTFTLVHVLLSLAGIGSGFIVVFGLLVGKRLDGWTAIFLVTT